MCSVLDRLKHLLSGCIWPRKRGRNKVVRSATPSDECCHRKCEPCRVERRARDIGAALLRDGSLSRVCERESSRPKPDFRSPQHSVEVKELASPSLRSFMEAQKLHIGDVRLYPVEGLQKTGGVSVDVSLAIDSFEHAPAPKVRRLINALAPLVAQLE